MQRRQMKVPASIRQLYEDQRAINNRLRDLIDRRIRGLMKPQWHYESRVKELASFALKIESGRFSNPHALEDFVACMIVVANATEAREAEKLIADNFPSKNVGHKARIKRTRHRIHSRLMT